ncbi:MAG: hypothetical protein AAGK37_23710, partial [Pseudomonadota bacterium]
QTPRQAGTGLTTEWTARIIAALTGRGEKNGRKHKMSRRAFFTDIDRFRTPNQKSTQPKRVSRCTAAGRQ